MNIFLFEMATTLGTVILVLFIMLRRKRLSS